MEITILRNRVVGERLEEIGMALNEMMLNDCHAFNADT